MENKQHTSSGTWNRFYECWDKKNPFPAILMSIRPSCSKTALLHNRRFGFSPTKFTTFLSHRAWSVYSSRIPKLRLIINLDFQDTLSFPPDAPTHLKANGTMHQQTIKKNQLQAGCSLGRASTLKVNKMKEVLNSKNAPLVYYMGVLLVEFPGVE